jgi:hypothetical protein
LRLPNNSTKVNTATVKLSDASTCVVRYLCKVFNPLSVESLMKKDNGKFERPMLPGGRDGALRRHRPRRAGGTYAVQRPITQIAPLDAARTASRGVGIPTKNNVWMRPMLLEMSWPCP